MVAIVTPILIGAVVQAIGTFFLKLLGLRVWSKRRPGAEVGVRRQQADRSDALEPPQEL
jgi:hypothetical protein